MKPENSILFNFSKPENEIFFAADGITSKSANDICNKAKESVVEYQAFLDNIRLTTKSVALAIKGDYIVESEGISDKELDKIDASIERKIRMDQLESWLREAIKAKEYEVKHAGGMIFSTWLEAFGKTEPETPVRAEYPDYIEEPEMPHILTEGEALAMLSVKERRVYYALEAQNGAYAKLVGPKGSLNLERRRMLNKKSNPSVTTGQGQDLQINREVPSVTISLLDEHYNRHIAKFNSGNSELNGIKKKIQDAIDKSSNDAHAEYQRLMEQYKRDDAERDDVVDKIDNEYMAAKRKYNNAMALLKNEYAEWQNAEKQAANALKILVPNDYKTLVDELRNLGK